MQFLLMCRSLTYAQRSARILERAGITAAVQRAPREITTRGCGYCVVVSARNGADSMERLTEAGLRPERVFRRSGGKLEEASL